MRGRSKVKKEKKMMGEKWDLRTLGSAIKRMAACPTKGCNFLASGTIVIIVIVPMGRQICQIHWIHIACSHNLGSYCVTVTLCSLIKSSDSSTIYTMSIRLLPIIYNSCQTQNVFRYVSYFS